jgi:hypothetical protein|tara:strand:+ start:242 stop:940 length:699 start_codon:yes stop_codon:yes gene_type:complete
MTKAKRNPNLFVHGNVSEAAQAAVLDGLDAGFTIDEMAGRDVPKIRAEAEFSQENLDELVKLKSKGSAIPGQSLVNNPDTPYPWEMPPEITNPREALDSLVEDILQPEVIKNIVSALAGGMPVGDIAMAILYSKFVDGIISVDLLMLLAEPVMYLIMAVGEEANIKYNIEGDDLDEFDDEEKLEEQELNPIEKIKQETLSKPITQNSVPQNLLDKVKEQGPEIRSMLSRGNE